MTVQQFNTTMSSKDEETLHRTDNWLVSSLKAIPFKNMRNSLHSWETIWNLWLWGGASHHRSVTLPLTRQVSWAVAPLRRVASFRACWKRGSLWSCLSSDWMASSACWLHPGSGWEGSAMTNKTEKRGFCWSQKGKLEVTIGKLWIICHMYVAPGHGRASRVCVCVCVCVCGLFICHTLWGAARRVWPVREVSHPLEGQNSLASFLEV